jgi:hypothetical protein
MFIILIGLVESIAKFSKELVEVDAARAAALSVLGPTKSYRVGTDNLQAGLAFGANDNLPYVGSSLEVDSRITFKTTRHERWVFLGHRYALLNE